METVGLLWPGWLGGSAIASKSNCRVIISWGMGSNGAGEAGRAGGARRAEWVSNCFKVKLLSYYFLGDGEQ